MKDLSKAGIATVVAAVVIVVLCTGLAQAVEVNWPEPNWPEIFEPNQLLTLYLTMDPCDWDLIRYDLPDPNTEYEGYQIEVPAWFWMTGEEANKIIVAVRRKPGDAFPDETDPNKISMKIDINQYYGVDPNAATEWHGLKKLSLENGDDTDVLAEGVAANLHRMASAPEGYDYDSWRASWVAVYVNGSYKGVYANQEQRDKRFMQHRDLYVHGLTWLYKQKTDGNFELKVGDDLNPKSPAVEELCYDPFVHTNTQSGLQPEGGICAAPNDVNLVEQLNRLMKMEGMLSMEATNAFLANPDTLFNQSANCYFLDFDDGSGRKRMYFAWDVDAVMVGSDSDIYHEEAATPWPELILSSSTFRSQYNQIMRDLLNGPLSEANIHAFLDDVNTPELRAALGADQYNSFDTPGEEGVVERFTQIKDWYSIRISNVLNQVEFDEPTLPPGFVLLDDGFEGATWDANWTGGGGSGWQEDTTTYARGSASAHADKNNYGDFNCIDLDASDATAIHIDFWCMKDDTEEAGDFALSYYNGTDYNDVCDLDLLGDDDEWLHYTDEITDSNYFNANFKIQFNATLGNNENVWVDDVIITKEAPLAIGGYIVDSNAALMDGVSVDANNAGGSDISDVNGYYELLVPFNWTGTVTPTKAGYTFEPNFRVYDVNVTEDVMDQNYTGTLLTYTISGAVTCEGSPFADVVMGGLPGDPCTDGSGNYTATVNYGWDGTVTPTKEGYSFEPNSTVYVDVNDNQVQDYTATLNTYTISGTVLVSGSPLADVTMGGLPSDPCTDGSGNYTATVDYGWDGTVTPAKEGYTFEPVSTGYVDVNDIQVQDYTATLLTYTISGTILVSGSPLAGVTMSGLPGAPVTDGNGFYTDTVDYGFSGTVTPQKAGYSFSPVNRPYSPVAEDHIGDDYTATLNTYTIAGTVTCSGSGLDGVTMNGLPGNPVTSGGGIYSVMVPHGWGNTVTPTKENYTFVPSERIYGSVTGHQLGHDYAATNTYDLDGDCSIGWGDVAVFCGNWLTIGPDGDFDNDGNVDFEDWAEFGLVW